MRVSLQEPEMDIRRLRGEDHVKTEAQLGVMLPEVKEHQGHQRLEEVRKGPPLEPGGMGALHSRTERGCSSTVLSQLYGNLLR